MPVAMGFPTTRIYTDRVTRQRRWHRLHESVLQRVVKAAVWRADIPNIAPQRNGARVARLLAAERERVGCR
jgi:hypothetical protein